MHLNTMTKLKHMLWTCNANFTNDRSIFWILASQLLETSQHGKTRRTCTCLNLSHNSQVHFIFYKAPIAGCNIRFERVTVWQYCSNIATANVHCHLVSCLIIVLKHHRVKASNQEFPNAMKRTEKKWTDLCELTGQHRQQVRRSFPWASWVKVYEVEELDVKQRKNTPRWPQLSAEAGRPATKDPRQAGPSTWNYLLLLCDTNKAYIGSMWCNETKAQVWKQNGHFTHAQTCDCIRVLSATQWAASVQTLHAQTCDYVCVLSATQWTASVHTLHMPKPMITFVFKLLRNALLRYIL